MRADCCTDLIRNFAAWSSLSRLPATWFACNTTRLIIPAASCPGAEQQFLLSVRPTRNATTGMQLLNRQPWLFKEYRKEEPFSDSSFYVRNQMLFSDSKSNAESAMLSDCSPLRTFTFFS